MKQLTVAVLLLSMPVPAVWAEQERWGALLWATLSEFANLNIPYNERRRCNVVGGIAWNFQTRAAAIRGARGECRKRWRSSGLRVVTAGYCGNLKYDDPIAAGTVLGVYFQTGQCAAWAIGRRSRSKCPRSGTAVGVSKEQAESKALKQCRLKGGNQCSIELSACNAGKLTAKPGFVGFAKLSGSSNYAIAWGFNEGDAAFLAIEECERRGIRCRYTVANSKRCITVARSNFGPELGRIGVTFGDTPEDAERDPDCRGSECRIIETRCNPNVPPPR